MVSVNNKTPCEGRVSIYLLLKHKSFYANKKLSNLLITSRNFVSSGGKIQNNLLNEVNGIQQPQYQIIMSTTEVSYLQIFILACSDTSLSEIGSPQSDPPNDQIQDKPSTQLRESAPIYKSVEPRILNL